MSRRFLFISLAFCLLGCGAPPPHWPAVRGAARDEVVALLQGYLRVDTSNPPGEELRAARYLARWLDREGIEHQIFDLGGGRANLRAILRGDGSRRPLVLLHHMDVVGAEAAHWRVPPFSGAVVDGEIYGRGAIDIKGKGAVDVAAMMHFKRAGRPLHRDLILLAVADEEGGSLGARWVVERHPELLAGAEFLLDEGASLRLDERGKPLAYLVSIAEKAPLWLTVRFSGRAGHGSEPIADSAVNRAVRAAARLLQRVPAPRLLPELRAFVKLSLRGRDLAGIPGHSADLDRALERPDFLASLASLEGIGPALTDTVAVTGLRGSDKVNVISNRAEIRLDCRLLPGTDRRRFLAELKETLGERSAEIRVDEYSESRASRVDTALFRALQRVAARRDPGVPVVPTILLSSTDSSHFRRLGVQAYGFEPYGVSEAAAARAHGNNERIGVQALREGVDLLVELIEELDQQQGQPR